MKVKKKTWQNYKFLSSLVIYYEQINNCEVTDGPLADHSGNVVIEDSGPRTGCRMRAQPLIANFSFFMHIVYDGEWITRILHLRLDSKTKQFS